MSQNRKVVDELIGRVLTDQGFRSRLFANPEETLRAEGYEPTPEILETIRKTNPADVDQAAKGIETQLADRKAAF